MNSNIFDRLSFFSLFLVVTLLPFFFLPFTNIPIETSKGLLLVVGLVACVIFWAISRFIDGKIIFNKSWLILSGLGVVLVFLFSALFSATPQVSLFGTMFDIGSFWFIFSAFILMFMSSLVFRSSSQAKIVLLGIILSSVIILVFQSAHLFMPKILSLGVLADKTGSILGSWNAVGLFAGFSILMFLLMIEFFPISKTRKLLLEIFILLGMLLASAVNFPLVWILLGVSSMIIFVYKASISLQRNENGEMNEKKRFPLVSFIVGIISLLFFMSSGFIGSIIPNYLKISNIEINPSFGTTLSITKDVLVKHPILGIGPNRFGEAWSMYKPIDINNTQFWDTSFESGSGLLPTLMSSTGIFGIIAFLVFFVLFLITGVKSVFSSIKNGVNWEMMAFFVLSLYLFVASFFYSAGSVIFLLAFAFTGVFIGLTASGSGKEMSLSFLNDHRKSFFSILALIFVVVLSVAVSFKYIERFASVSYVRTALSASTIPVAEKSITKALALYSNDLYLRTYSQVYLAKINSIITSRGSSALSDSDKADLQANLDQAVKSAQMATEYNPSNYLNFKVLGSVYETAGSLGVKDAYTNAVATYKIASDLNPLNPGLKLAIAGSLFADKKVKDAKDFGKQALSLKSDYVNALVFLSQVAKSEGNNSEALSYAQTALAISPTNTDLAKYVDSLKSPASAVTSTTKK